MSPLSKTRFSRLCKGWTWQINNESTCLFLIQTLITDAWVYRSPDTPLTLFIGFSMPILLLY